MKEIFNVRVKIILLDVGSLEAIPKLFVKKLEEIVISVGIGQNQKPVLLGTAITLRKALKI